jgi:hypothetical protein
MIEVEKQLFTKEVEEIYIPQMVEPEALPNDNYPRIGMSFFMPLPVFRQTHSNFFGDFNKKDALGRNASNLHWYPAFTPMIFTTKTINAPFEEISEIHDEEPTPAPFDVNGFMRRFKAGSTKSSTRILSAKQCAENAVKEFSRFGLGLLNSVFGVYPEAGLNQPAKEMALAVKLIDLLLPLKNTQLFPKTQRIKAGTIFESPFGDEIRKFLTNSSPTILLQLLQSNELTNIEKEVAKNLLSELQAGIARGLKSANELLNQSEAAISNPNDFKQTYDVPNLGVSHAGPAPDLYALAFTNRAEIEMRPLEASKNLSDGIVKGLENLFQNSAVPTADLEGILQAQRAEHQAEMEATNRRWEERFAALESQLPKKK